MHRILPLILWFTCLPLFWLGAQERLNLGQNNYQEQKGIVYDKEFSVDLKLHTNGAAFGLNFGQIQTFYKTRYWHFEFGELKHVRETRQSKSLSTGLFGGNFRSFVFGKQNNFFALRAGLGEKRYLSEKAQTKGLAVGLSYEGGPTLGLLKPYYLVLRYVDEERGQANFRAERYSEENADRFLNYIDIYGAESFSRGIGEIGLRPGIHGKFALHFDWGAFDDYVKAFEAGIMFDYFFGEVPIMVETPLIEGSENQSYFINLFLCLQFGRRS